MRSKRWLVLVISVLVLITVLILQTFGVTGIGTRIGFQTVGKGSVSGYENSAYYVINNADQWADIWNEHVKNLFPQPSLPDVDFSRSTIIAVFMGLCRTTGYGIEVKEIVDTGLSVVVKVEKTYPGEGCVVGEMLTYPYHIVKVDKISKYILFGTTTSAKQCLIDFLDNR